MNIFTYVKDMVMRLLGLSRLKGNPNDGRLTYIDDDEAIRIWNIRANRCWYLGDGSELLNLYTNGVTYGFAKNPIYNRNKTRYFWSESVPESMKRIHSGVPKAIIDTTSNIVSMPTITGPEAERINAIFDANNFEFMLCQRARPMTLVEGDGAFKINIDTELSQHPIIEYYGAEDWGPIHKSNALLGMWFASYYKNKDDKDFMLIETRTRRKDGLAIEYRLFKALKDNQIVRCDIGEIPELGHLEDRIIYGMKSLLAVPLKYYFDPLRPNRGKSIYDGKLDMFDFLDEILSQASQTDRVSGPVEYYPTDLLQRTDKGVPVMPSLYNRQYVAIESMPDGDGNLDNRIQTTQPSLEFDKYMSLFRDALNCILIGVLSPSSLGIDIAKDDNADAQREKEKQTIFTRNTIIKNETKAISELCSMLIDAQEYIDTGRFVGGDKQIGVKYDEFANPSFESELQVLGPAWAAGEISTERYVSLLWSGKLSDEEMAKEVAWLDENRSKDDFDVEALMRREDEKANRADIPGFGAGSAEADVAEE